MCLSILTCHYLFIYHYMNLSSSPLQRFFIHGPVSLPGHSYLSQSGALACCPTTGGHMASLKAVSPSHRWPGVGRSLAWGRCAQGLGANTPLNGGQVHDSQERSANALAGAAAQSHVVTHGCQRSSVGGHVTFDGICILSLKAAAWYTSSKPTHVLCVKSWPRLKMRETDGQTERGERERQRRREDSKMQMELLLKWRAAAKSWGMFWMHQHHVMLE